ncbi:carbohydrate kinase family protein [Roseimicrobium sp. ORNL1]|uniref:carbohydrate kinase family protein n=1 Tax=Roseimicrobium sp. ORNL1 TaxID=2711231 RepID=UPI0013E16691|nr:carbohydrate kinase family protein [Roseimicrobium sp. ORNL1]QIF02511.1 carbohydrate kinase family protein [Roseimicrobium sp. ORNL1]
MRTGILAAGNFIIDYVKIIDAWPEQDMLSSIRSETSSNGGGPYNVLKDLAAMGASYPLEACGLVGDDANGAWIQQDCAKAGINTRQLHHTANAPTSYTDAMTVASTGRRTFFHQRGANAHFNETHVNFADTNAKHFHLGYLMLLDAMDSFVSGGRTRASLALEAAKNAGLTTSVDIVSTENPQFREIAESALPYTDVLIINEIEAGKVAGMTLKNGDTVDVEGCVTAARALLDRGVLQQVVIHFVEGGVVVSKDGTVTKQTSLKVPSGFIVGATGAGDAFAAGYLHGWHEQWDVSRCLKTAVCTAAACLTHATPSLGLRSVEECLNLGEAYGYRSL